MPNDSSISVTPRLAISIRTPQGEAIVQLTRLSAQVLASTLRAYSGLPSKGIDLNAGNFRTVHGEAVPTPKNALPVVRLHPVKSSALRSAPGSSTMERARATLTIKAVAEADGRRTFSGVASTPVVDRQGDIVVPEGAEFTLPLALLWAHDTKQPIGWVRRAVAMTAGILVEGEVAQIAEAGRLKDRLDEAWGMMKAGLVRGLSIGFRALKTVPIASGLRIERWSWLELSAVTIPANEGAGITAIKHAGATAATGAVDADPSFEERLAKANQELGPASAAKPVNMATLHVLIEVLTDRTIGLAKKQGSRIKALEARIAALEMKGCDLDGDR